MVVIKTLLAFIYLPNLAFDLQTVNLVHELRFSRHKDTIPDLVSVYYIHTA